MISMEGKVALVTGGGAGIGRAIVDAYAQLGATLVIAEVDAGKCATLCEALGDAALVSETDVRDTAQVEALEAEVRTRFGRLDVLVNNVGHHLWASKPFEQSSESEWDDLYQINLRHMFVVTRAFIPLMRVSGEGGSIINISSIEGFRGFPNNVAYTTFKHAVTGFTRAVAMQLAPEQIRVNCIGPETTDTEQVPLGQMIRPEKREAANRTLPMNRFGRPEDHAGVAIFLATNLSQWMTGSCLIVDGGGHCAGGFQRTPEGKWTIIPEVIGMAT